MLTPTDVHILVGMLTYRANQNPENIDIELGSMVLDAAAEKERDIDITVTVRQVDGSISGYTGLEVKNESRALDVVTVEQLCSKFNDMPSIMYKGIVSASGYTAAAIKKARYHGIDLFNLAPWADFPPNFEYLSLSSRFKFQLRQLEWENSPNVHFNPTQVLSESTTQAMTNQLPIYTEALEFSHLQNLGALAGDVSSFVLQELIKQRTTDSMQDNEKLPVTFQVEIPQQPYVHIDGETIVINQATVQGTVIWHPKDLEPEFKVLIKVGETKPYIACAIAELPNSNLLGVTFNDSRQVGLINIPNSDRLLKKIYRKKLFS